MSANLFDVIGNHNQYGTSYWSAHELMPLLGYTSWRRFVGVMERAEASCRNTGELIEHHFVATGEGGATSSGAQREVKDYFLSRFACYLIAMNGDPRKPEIASAQAYFAVQTRRQELFEQLTDEEKRLLVRERVVDSNKKLSQAAKESGVRSHMFGVFHDAGYKGLYGGLGVQDLKELKGIEKQDDVLDRMGRAELAANEFRITQTEQKLKNEHVQGEQQAIDTHHAVGQEVRETIKRLGGTMPEDLPTEPSIRPLLEKKRRAQKKLPPSDGPQQGTLL